MAALHTSHMASRALGVSGSGVTQPCKYALPVQTAKVAPKHASKKLPLVILFHQGATIVVNWPLESRHPSFRSPGMWSIIFFKRSLPGSS